MKCQITSMTEYEIKDGFNDVEYCFLITANPIDTESNAMSEEDLNKLILEGGDISEIANKSNISPFRTILFPNTSQICDVFLSLLDKNEERERKGEKPIFPTINLNRFEQETPEPYFRRYTKDGDGIKEGDWIIAQTGDEMLPNDPMKRKVFRSIWVTSICKTDANGVDVPTENVVRKAARAYTNGLETQAGSGKMIVPCAMQMKLEAKKAVANAPKENDQTGGDELLTNEFEGEQTQPRRRRRQGYEGVTPHSDHNIGSNRLRQSNFNNYVSNQIVVSVYTLNLQVMHL